MTREEIIELIGLENVEALEREEAEATSRLIYPAFEPEHANMTEYCASLELENGIASAYYYQDEDCEDDLQMLDWAVERYEFEEH